MFFLVEVAGEQWQSIGFVYLTLCYFIDLCILSAYIPRWHVSASIYFRHFFVRFTYWGSLELCLNFEVICGLVVLVNLSFNQNWNVFWYYLFIVVFLAVSLKVWFFQVVRDLLVQEGVGSINIFQLCKCYLVEKKLTEWNCLIWRYVLVCVY